MASLDLSAAFDIVNIKTPFEDITNNQSNKINPTTNRNMAIKLIIWGKLIGKNSIVLDLTKWLYSGFCIRTHVLCYLHNPTF